MTQTIALIDDDRNILTSLSIALEKEGFKVQTYLDGESALIGLTRTPPDLAIVDIKMPKMDGIEATKLIKKQLPDTGIIAFSMFDQTEAIRQMLDAGASGYVLKNSSLETLKKAIKKVASGETYFDSQIDLSLIETDDFNDEKGGLLTKRQVEILRHIALGKTSREIADELFIGVHTVDTHRKNMMRILELKGKGELLRYALERKYDF